MNSKRITDNKEKIKSKKKQEALEIHLKKLANLTYEDRDLTGQEIAEYVDALAGAKKAISSIERAIEDGEEILRAAMMRQWCEHLANTGHRPELRRSFGTMGSCKVIQQQTAKLTKEKADGLAERGVNLEPYVEKNSYTIRMGNASTEATKQIIAMLRRILGDDYPDIVSEYVSVGERFFADFDDIIKQSLGDEEILSEKMLSIMRVLKPVIQFTDWDSDLSPQGGFDLAHEFAQISAQKQSALKSAKADARAERAEKKRKEKKK